MIRLPGGSDPDDSEALARQRLEAQAGARDHEAEELQAALDVVERAAGQVHPKTLPLLAERLGRAYSRAMARLREQERQAVRERVRAARGEP